MGLLRHHSGMDAGEMVLKEWGNEMSSAQIDEAPVILEQSASATVVDEQPDLSILFGSPSATTDQKIDDGLKSPTRGALMVARDLRTFNLQVNMNRTSSDREYLTQRRGTCPGCFGQLTYTQPDTARCNFCGAAFSYSDSNGTAMTEENANRVIAH
jgi:hypothetical protein